MSFEAPIRIGVVGLGYIGTTVGAQFHRNPDAEISAVCDPDEYRLDEVGIRFDVPPHYRYADDERMLDDAPLDAVLIGTPHTLHFEQVIRALDRGLDVYCDKPLTTDLERARTLAERAEGGNETLMVGYQRHLQTAFNLARDRFRESTPEWFTASITQNWLEYSRGTWRVDPSLSGGGFLYDTGSHVIDGVLWTTSLEPTAVRASMDFVDEDSRIDRRAHLDVRFDGGTTGTFSFNGDVAAVREHVHVWDDDGALYLEGRGWGSRRVFEIDENGNEFLPYIDRSRERNRAEAFVESVRTGAEPPATARDALAVTALTEAAYESATTDEWVAVGE